MNTRRFSNEATSVSEARRFTCQTLSGTPQEQLQTIELMVSELATNCIRHAHTDFQVTIYRHTTEIRVEVTDHAAGTPVVRTPGPTDPTGRGLQIVQILSDEWGVTHNEKRGKTVWFTLSTERLSEAQPTSALTSQILASRRTPHTKTISPNEANLNQPDGLDASARTHTRPHSCCSSSMQLQPRPVARQGLQRPR